MSLTVVIPETEIPGELERGTVAAAVEATLLPAAMATEVTVETGVVRPRSIHRAAARSPVATGEEPPGQLEALPAAGERVRVEPLGLRMEATGPVSGQEEEALTSADRAETGPQARCGSGGNMNNL